MILTQHFNPPGNELCEHVVCSSKFGFLVSPSLLFVYFIQLTHPRSFWKVAIPIMIVVIPIALMGDLKKLWHYMQKKTATRKAVKVSLMIFQWGIHLLSIILWIYQRICKFCSHHWVSTKSFEARQYPSAKYQVLLSSPSRSFHQEHSESVTTLVRAPFNLLLFSDLAITSCNYLDEDLLPAYPCNTLLSPLSPYLLILTTGLNSRPPI